MAVPLFFVITGFFLPNLILKKDLNRHLIKIIRITVWAILLYFFLLCIESIIKGVFPDPLYKLGTWKDIIRRIVLGRTPFAINGGHLWYLFAIIYVLAFITIFTKKHPIKKLYILIPILFIIGYIISSIPGINRTYYQNYLFTGLPYVLLGSYIKENRCGMTFPKSLLNTLLILAPFLLALEILVYVKLNIPSRREHYLSIILTVSLLLIWATRHPNFGVNSKLNIIGHKYSLYIYIFHFYIVQHLWILFHGDRWDSKWQMLTSIMITLAISYLYVRSKLIIVKKYCK